MSGEWLSDIWDEEFTTSSNVTDMETTENTTLFTSCVARSIHNPAVLPYSSALTTTVRSLQTVVYILVSMLGIFLNTLLIVLVAKYKKLHSRSFAIALQVVTVNLFLASTVLLIHPLNSIANRWLFGEHLCMLAAYIYLTYLLLRTLLMFTFVVDRFLSVFWPYTYPKHSQKIMTVISISTWVIALGARIIPGVLDCFSYVPTSYQCVHSSRCSPACVAAANANLAFVFGPATIIPIVLYAALYCKALQFRKIELRMAKTNSGSREKREKMEWKATITFFMLFVSLFTFTTPVVFLNILFSSISRDILRSPYMFVMRSVLSSMTSLLVVVDPIVIMRNKDVSEILFRITRKERTPSAERGKN